MTILGSLQVTVYQVRTGGPVPEPASPPPGCSAAGSLAAPTGLPRAGRQGAGRGRRGAAPAPRARAARPSPPPGGN